MFKFNRLLRNHNGRDGITIIEVLTSMAVATIGVFGVMVMIPFAVKQSQTGLDNDAANALGRNTIEELQILGLLQTGEAPIAGAVDDVFSRMTFVNSTPGPFFGAFFNPNLSRAGEGFPVGGPPPFDFRFPGTFHFDPIGFANGLTETQFTTSPDLAGDQLTILSATANRLTSIDVDNDGTLDFVGGVAGPFGVREAARLCRSRDELFFSEDVDNELQVAPPQPLYDVDGTGSSVKRQFGGRISWSAFFVPEIDPGLTSSTISRYRSHVLVYRDRFVNPAELAGPAPFISPPSNYTTFLVDRATTVGVPANHFQSTVSQIQLATPIPDDTIFRGDWVMVVNRIPTPLTAGLPVSEPELGTGITYRAADNGFRTQLMFAQVSRVTGSSVTVDGGAFDFVAPGIPATPPAGTLPSSETYMVLLRNVVNVYQRSISVER